MASHLTFKEIQQHLDIVIINLNFSADFKQTSDKPIFCGGGWNLFPSHPKSKNDDDDYTHDWT